MGRANRPDKIHQALHELHEEGLPPGWQEYWQGSKEVIIEEFDPADLSDSELLEHLADAFSSARSNFDDEGREVTLHLSLQAGAILVHDSKNRREYRGGILVRGNRDGGATYHGFTQWGRSGSLLSGGSTLKAHYKGDSLQEAVRTVNEILEEKILVGYQPSNGELATVSYSKAREKAEKSLQKLLQEAR